MVLLQSTTILNFCNINNSMIDCIFDTIGKKLTQIQLLIINYSKIKYKHVFLFAWNHKRNFKKEKKKN